MSIGHSSRTQSYDVLGFCITFGRFQDFGNGVGLVMEMRLGLDFILFHLFLGCSFVLHCFATNIQVY